MGFQPQIIEGLHAGQSVNMFEAFDKFFNRLKELNKLPSRIIELGTCCGGFTVFLKKHPLVPSNCELYTYDFTDWNLSGRDGATKDGREILKSLNIKFIQADIFAEETIKNVKNLIQMEGTSIVFCDGGDKKVEFNLFSEFLKSGDIILAHDYIDTVENFEANFKGKIWDGQEIKESDITGACQKYNLKPFMQEELSKAVWASRMKE
jgi:23S rRNA U2552 (ribose-2'-O)-methylase RlmE/FtsJ